MPQAHTHHDRGTLHDDCPACTVVANMMTEAGVDPAQVRDYRREADTESPRHVRLSGLASQLRHAFGPFNVSVPEVDTDIAGVEMGNKASVIQDEGEDAELVYLSKLLTRARLGTIPYAVTTQLGHAYLDHEHFMIPLDLSLGQAQEVHAGLHHMGIGHEDSPGHFVAPFPREALKSRQRALLQRVQSRGAKAVRAEQHARREQAARASREAVMTDSARALKRAIEHTKGTVLPRATFDTLASAHVTIQVGVRDRITVATATIGHDTAVGTAVCHPTDRFDAQTGRQLAIARALVALGATHELEWMNRVTERNT